MKKLKTNIVLFASSIFFLPSFFTPEPTPIPVHQNTYNLENKFQSSWKDSQSAILGIVTYQTLSKEELEQLYKPKDIPVPSDQQLQGWFDHYSSVFNVSSDTLRKIAYCESHFNPGAVNGIYGGMYQYSTNTWISTRNAMGENPDPSLRFNPEAAIKTSAFKIASGGIGAWPVCGK